MYEIQCFTNLDDFRREGWPTKLFNRPFVGDYITSKSGEELSIIKISHLFDGTLLLELHRPNYV